MPASADHVSAFHDRPVFLVGCGRSGTTLLLSILAADPTLHCIPEETEVFKLYRRPDFDVCLQPDATLQSLQDYARKLSDTLPRHPLARALRRLRMRMTLRRYPAPTPEARRWVEKSPIHIRSLQLIRACYRGRARFIELVRDGRDVILSRHPNQHREFHIHPERWVYDVGVGMGYRRDSDVLTVRYEDLILDFERTLTNLYAFLEQPFPESVKHFADTTRLRTHDAWADGVRPLSPKSIGKWKKPEYAERVQTLLDLPLAEDLLRANGYLH